MRRLRSGGLQAAVLCDSERISLGGVDAAAPLNQVLMSMTHGIPRGHDRARCSSGYDEKERVEDWREEAIERARNGERIEREICGF